MKSIHIPRAIGIAAVVAAFLAGGIRLPAQSPKGRVIDREIRSENIALNKIGTDAVRRIVVYLPAGYDASTKRYPVIYFLPTPLESYRAPFDKRNAQGLFDRAIDWSDRQVHSRLCRYDDAPWEFVVCEFSCDRKLGRLHDPGTGALHGCELQNLA